MRDKMVDIMPEMKTGKELLDCLRETPEYPACIWEKSSMERLVALSDIYNVYIPSRMSVEIYHKLYMVTVYAEERIHAGSIPEV